MKKADYSKIASFFDKGRPLPEQNIEQWLGIICRLSGAGRGTRLLDLGCGTGRFSFPFAVNLGCHVTGADSSPEMLARARKKDNGRLITWDIADAQFLPYKDESFDVVFMSHLLHHVDSPQRVIRGCYRVLVRGGVILVRYGAIDQIRNDIEHTFFPETLAIDQDRGISSGMVETWLHEAGFLDVISEEIVQRSFADAAAHLKADLNKCTSVLTMISPQAYKKGIAELRKYVRDHPDDPWLLYDRMTITAGYKR
ncbi:MAG TPA: methyltransferase domain-containing protein [Dehalococcoidia bacterium]|nr:methyltransferase domain-containing protein [Dehalococcoidia bacterium]